MGFSRSTLLVLGAVALAGLVLCLVAGPAPESFGPPRLLPPGADVVRLELDFGTAVRLERTAQREGGDEWRIVGPPTRPADPGVVDAILAALDVAVPVRALAIDAVAPAPRLGLAPPRGKVVVGMTGGRTVEITFGAALPGEPRVYARTSLHPDLALVLDDGVERSANRTPDELRDRRLWTLDPDRIAALDVVAGEHHVRLERTGRRFRVTPPGCAADPERAARPFDALAAPRAVGFPAGADCAGAAGLVATVSTDDGGPRVLRFPPQAAAPCPGCPPDAVSACANGTDVVALPRELEDTLRAVSADLARTSLTGAFDPADVGTVSFGGPGTRGTLRRESGAWRFDGADAPAIDDAAVARWLRAVSLVAVDPARAAQEPFVPAGSLELVSRIGGAIRVRLSVPAPDGTVVVRRDGEAVTFRLAAADAYLLDAPRAHLESTNGAACDPLAVAGLEVRTPAGPVQALRREEGGRWALEGADLPADATGADLLVGDLCRLPLQPLVPRASVAPEPGWTAVLRDAAGRELLRLEIFADARGAGSFAADAAGGVELHVLSPAAVERLRRPLVAAGALDIDPAHDGAAIDVRCAGAPAVRLSREGGSWRASSPAVPDALAAGFARAFSAPPLAATLALDASADPSSGWRRPCRIDRVPVSGAASTLVVGGPDSDGRVLAWSAEHRALFELQRSVLGDLALLQSLAAE